MNRFKELTDLEVETLCEALLCLLDHGFAITADARPLAERLLKELEESYS